MRVRWVSSFVAGLLVTACAEPLPVVEICSEGDPRPAVRLPPSGRTRLVYSTTVDGRPQLYLLDFDRPGAAPERLDAIGTGPGPLRLDGNVSNPAGVWSPAGGRVAVALGDAIFEPARVGVIDVASPGTVRELGGDILAFPPFERAREAWSPHGDHLVESDPAGGVVRVLRADGGGAEVIASGIPGTLADATWSPDGRYVGFEAWDDDSTMFYVSPADAADPRPVASYNYRWGRAGSQVLGYVDDRHWEAIDIEAGRRTLLEASTGSVPVYSADGRWLLTPSPPAMRPACGGDPVLVAGAPPHAMDPRATADGDHIVFQAMNQAGGLDASTAWVLDRVGDRWEARHVYTPTMSPPRVDAPVVSATGSRVAWVLAVGATQQFLVTRDGVRDPKPVAAVGIVQQVSPNTHWFSPDLRRLAYLAGTVEQATLRVLDLEDPAAPVMLGELVAPGQPIVWASWSPNGNALAYVAGPGFSVPPPVTHELFAVEVTGGALGAPRALGSTVHPHNDVYDWEP
ncbi:MAG: hypothetical protein K8M05_30140 [Deltaproteobacteria bacterium]|nr:hypothetical protein [Kofleriaceae bacterium]